MSSSTENTQNQNNANTDDNTVNKEQKDETTVVALNDTPNETKQELDRAGTTVIHLSEQSQKDINYEGNVKARKNIDPKDKKENHKELSQIPYKLQRLHHITQMSDVLRVTKLKDLFAVSYIFRYIVCSIIGCLCFLFLAFLWKVLFRINTCRIEQENLQFKFMAFSYGFMSAFEFGLLVSAPLLHILLPTVGVTHHHRTRFIIAFLFIIFTIFTCYGFEGSDWDKYSYISSSILGVVGLVIFFYWGGYFAFWVIFPLFSAVFVAVLIMGLMREYGFAMINSNPVIFGLVYPIYLTILQQIALKCMLWFRLPYKIRQFFTNCCPHCCCKTDKLGQTPVYYDGRQFDNVWQPSKHDLKYSSKRLSTKSVDLEVNTANKKEANDETETEINHEQTDTAIIIKTKSAHRYKSTELELTVEDVWSNDILFVAGGTVIVLMESMRVAGMVALKDDYTALILNVLSSIILESASRNNLYWELIYRCILKKPNPGLTRFFSTIIGTRYQTEYIPYFVIFMMNLTKFGPTDSCTMTYLGSSVSMAFDTYLYMYVILFVSEILSDCMADCIKKCGRKRGWFGDEINGDPAREATYVKLRPWMMVCIFIAFFTISLIAYQIDYDAKTSGSN